MPSAVSFSQATLDPRACVRALLGAKRRLKRPTGALLFISGNLVPRIEELARTVAAEAPGLPVVLAAGAGVLTEAGEIEGQAAVAGMLWEGGRPEAFGVEGKQSHEVAVSFARAFQDRAGRRAPGAVVLLETELLGVEGVEPLGEARGTAHVVGAGAAGSPGVASVDAGGKVTVGGAAAMLFHGLGAPAIRASPACRLLMPPRRITEIRGRLVLGIDGEPALDVLEQVGRGLSGQPLILAALAEGVEVGEEPSALLLRPVHGVDPARRGLMVGGDVRPGSFLAFAVRDGEASRRAMQRTAFELERDLAGAAPRFGLFFNCAGRGARLYGAPDVDTRILKARLAGVPFAGMASAFEVAPYQGLPAFQLYTGVFSLFRAAS